VLIPTLVTCDIAAPLGLPEKSELTFPGISKVLRYGDGLFLVAYLSVVKLSCQEVSPLFSFW